MSIIVYPDHHRDDQTLNDLLASLRLTDSPQRVPQPLPLVPPRAAPIPDSESDIVSSSRPSGSGISNATRVPSSAHASFGSPVNPPRPLDSPPPSPNFDPTDIAFWDQDPDVNPLGPSERTYNVSVGSETGVIHTWYVSNLNIYLLLIVLPDQAARFTCVTGLSWRKSHKNQDR